VKAYNDVKHFETTYVVKMHAFKQLSPAQPCWTFDHPNNESPIDNTRESEHTFEVQRSSCLHGFAGFFDAHLYGDVHISIYPETFSTGMFSWFPLFFPIRFPMYIPKDTNVKLRLWRCVADKKVLDSLVPFSWFGFLFRSLLQVWYEWAVVEPSVGPVNNVNGRSFSIGL
jgi:protein arginine N-methyltransferase 5